MPYKIKADNISGLWKGKVTIIWQADISQTQDFFVLLDEVWCGCTNLPYKKVDAQTDPQT